MGPKFFTSSTFWTFFSLVAAIESWAQDGCRRDHFPRYSYIRGFSWCLRDVTDITFLLAAVIRSSLISVILAGVPRSS
jgi:hypothetical protein